MIRAPARQPKEGLYGAWPPAAGAHTQPRRPPPAVGNHERLWPGSGDRFPQQYDRWEQAVVGLPAALRMLRSPRCPRLTMPAPAPPRAAAAASAGCLTTAARACPRRQRTGRGTRLTLGPSTSYRSAQVRRLRLLCSQLRAAVPKAACATAGAAQHALCAPRAALRPAPAPAEHLFEPGSEQHAFIERDLRAVNRTATPWVVLGGHRPVRRAAAGTALPSCTAGPTPRLPRPRPALCSRLYLLPILPILLPPQQLYIDSTWYGLAPDGDQHMAQLLRDSLEDLLYRYQVGAAAAVPPPSAAAAAGALGAHGCVWAGAGGQDAGASCPPTNQRPPASRAALWISRPCDDRRRPGPLPQVDVSWTGHHHTYQRTCAVHRGRCLGASTDGVAAAPVHLVIGACAVGACLGSLLCCAAMHRAAACRHLPPHLALAAHPPCPCPSIPAGHAGAGITPNIHFFRPRIFQKVLLRHGYMRATANATHLAHTVVSSQDGGVMDELVLTKPPGWRFQPRDPAGGGGWDRPARGGPASGGGKLLGGRGGAAAATA